MPKCFQTFFLHKDINNENKKEIRELRMSFIKNFEEDEWKEDIGEKNNNNKNKGKNNVHNIINNMIKDAKDNNDDEFLQLYDIEIAHQNNQIL